MVSFITVNLRCLETKTRLVIDKTNTERQAMKDRKRRTWFENQKRRKVRNAVLYALCLLFFGFVVFVTTEWDLGLPVVYISNSTGQPVRAEQNGKPLSLEKALAGRYHYKWVQ